MISEATKSEGGTGHHLQKLEEAKEGNGSQAFVLEVNNSSEKGYIFGRNLGSKRKRNALDSEIFSVFVPEPLRRCGFATQLLQTYEYNVKEKAKNAGLSMVRICVDVKWCMAKAADFWKKNGYEKGLVDKSSSNQIMVKEFVFENGKWGVKK